MTDRDPEIILPYTHETLEVLHKTELAIRIDSILTINSEPDLKEHLALVDNAMRFLHLTCTEHVSRSEEEDVFLAIGSRLFNSIALALQSLLGGYYQGSIASIRDVVEIGFLCDYFFHQPKEVRVWRDSDPKTRTKKFKPSKIRESLDAHDGFEGKKRQQTYALLCEYGSHVTYTGLLVLGSQNQRKVGPFFEPRYLRGCLEDIAKFCPSSVFCWQMSLDELSPLCYMAHQEFLRTQEEWFAKYFGQKCDESDSTRNSTQHQGKTEEVEGSG